MEGISVDDQAMRQHLINISFAKVLNAVSKKDSTYGLYAFIDGVPRQKLSVFINSITSAISDLSKYPAITFLLDDNDILL